MEAVATIRNAVLDGEGVTSLKRKFKNMDTSQDLKISFEEFSSGLGEYGVKLTEEVKKQAFDYIDKDGSGSIDIDEFFNELQPRMPENRRAMVKVVFDKMDATGDGFVTMEDLEGRYDYRSHPMFVMGYYTEEQCKKDFLSNFKDSNKDGKVSLDEVEEHFTAMSASIGSDSLFNTVLSRSFSV